jgi:hypothetical protein
MERLGPGWKTLCGDARAIEGKEEPFDERAARCRFTRPAAKEANLMRRKTTDWAELAVASVMLGQKAGQVIALRMATLALGGPHARAESRMMLPEKMKAAMDANIAAAASVMMGQPHLAPRRALSVYRKRVNKNLARLSKKK